MTTYGAALELKEALEELGVNLNTIMTSGWTFNPETRYVTVTEFVLDEEGGHVLTLDKASLLTRKRKFKLNKGRAKALAAELAKEKNND